MTGPPESGVRAELVRLLRADSTRLGQVYRLTEEGLTADAIAQKLGVRTSGFVSNNRIVARAITDGVLPRGHGLTRAAASRVRGLLRANQVSPRTSEYLESLLFTLERGEPKVAQSSPAVVRKPSPGGAGSQDESTAEMTRPRRREAQEGRRGWKSLVAQEIAHNYRTGEIFTLADFYRRSEDRLQFAYRHNTTVRATTQNILQRLRHDGVLEFLRRGEYRYLEAPKHVEDTELSVRRLLEKLVERIADQTSLDADDYLDAATSDNPYADVRSLVYGGRTSPTFRALYGLGRLDLTLEQLAVDNPELFDRETLTESAGRLQYYSAT